VWAGQQLAMGKSFQADNMVPHIGHVKYDRATKTLILGKPVILDKSNIASFPYF